MLWCVYVLGLACGRVNRVWGLHWEAARRCGRQWCRCGEVFCEECAKCSSADAACEGQPWAAGWWVTVLLRTRACARCGLPMRA